jgi:hypothetical protein
MNYYYTDRTNQPRGPIGVEELRNLARSGQLNSATMVAAVGSPHWIPLSAVVPDIALATAGITDPFAVWSLILGIAGFFACWACCGPILSIPAVILGHISRVNIKRDPGLGGKGLAIAGLVTGYVAIALFLLYFFVVGSVAFLGALTDAAN